jgi:hypothetical protein
MKILSLEYTLGKNNVSIMLPHYIFPNPPLALAETTDHVASTKLNFYDFMTTENVNKVKKCLPSILNF